MIRRNFRFTNDDIRIKLFKALALPILTYCMSVRWPKEIGLSLKLESILRSFTKSLVTEQMIKSVIFI